VEPIEPFLSAVHERLSKQVDEFDAAIGPYAQYALGSNGKHLRPALVALTANTLGDVRDEHVTAAVVIEMVHLATLAHDDVMDESAMRRGRPTLAANWGNEIAVLFGDCLFAQALKLAAGFPTPDVCRAVAAATNTVCAGEILQTRHRRDFCFSQDEYFRVLEMKTAELFALSCELAAYLSDATASQQAALRRFGLDFGTAYQIYDDCLDLVGSESSAGKSLGTDLAKGKLTLPLLLLWERASDADRSRLKGLVEEWEVGSLQQVGALITKYDTLTPSLARVQKYLDRALVWLREMPASRGRVCLASVTKNLAEQTESLAFGTGRGV
jgi:octaprenyl-diphosphate synthase